MIQRLTWVRLTDSSLAQWLRVFHLYGGFNRHYSPVGYIVKGSIRVVHPPTQYYKGYTVKVLKKGRVSRALLVRQTYVSSLFDNRTRQFKINSGVLMKKKNTFISAHITGPVSRQIRKKRLLTLFKGAF